MERLVMLEGGVRPLFLRMYGKQRGYRRMARINGKQRS